jgi:hypothetical protein
MHVCYWKKSSREKNWCFRREWVKVTRICLRLGLSKIPVTDVINPHKQWLWNQYKFIFQDSIGYNHRIGCIVFVLEGLREKCNSSPLPDYRECIFLFMFPKHIFKAIYVASLNLWLCY